MRKTSKAATGPFAHNAQDSECKLWTGDAAGQDLKARCFACAASKTDSTKTARKIPTRGIVIGAAIALVFAGTMASCTAGATSGTDTGAADARVADCQVVINAMNDGLQSAMGAFKSQIDLTMSAAAGGSLETILVEQQLITDRITAATAELDAVTASCE